MFTSGVSTSAEAVAEPPPEATEKSTVEKLAYALWHVLNRKEVAENERLESRRYRDPREHDPDYARHLRELEGDIRESDRGFRMHDYHEGGGRFDKWAIPGLVTLAVSGIIGNVVQAMAVSALRQEVTDLKIEIDRIERIVEPRYRGG
jgi:hypothetical protein